VEPREGFRSGCVCLRWASEQLHRTALAFDSPKRFARLWYAALAAWPQGLRARDYSESSCSAKLLPGSPLELHAELGAFRTGT
jgi:hypothetical protein